jgi:nucleotide-binding universal stress UspA family protein
MINSIIVLFNGISAPWHVTTFALNIAKQSDTKVVALFLKDETRKNPYPNDMALSGINTTGDNEEAADQELVEKNIQVFKAFCNDENVSCDFERNITLAQLVDLSSGADLLLADSHSELRYYSLKDILAEVKCPVCLISVNATEIKKTILLFDGSSNALHAITTYSALFPKFCEEKSYLVTINEKGKEKSLDQEAVMQRLGQFCDLEEISLSGNTEKKLIEFLDEHTENAIVVMGAYGRSAISLLFNPSLSNVVLEQSRTSLFIAHD